MTRILLPLIAVLLACTACNRAPETAAVSAAAPANVHVADKGEISADQVKSDIVGRVVKTSDAAGKGPADEWTFEASEYKQAEIIESKRMSNELIVTVHMLTRNNPKPEENSIQVAGRLRLHYEMKGGKWMLKSIDNLSFQYSIGVAT